MDLNPDEAITLRLAPNGGWVVTQRAEQPGLMDRTVAAYSNAPDMLRDLRDCLSGDNLDLHNAE